MKRNICSPESGTGRKKAGWNRCLRKWVTKRLRMISANYESCKKTMLTKEGGKRHLIAVSDGEQRVINGWDMNFFDIHSTKEKQFDFTLEQSGERLVCCGDEPYNLYEEKYVRQCKWPL